MFETSVGACQSARRNVVKVRRIHSRYRENLQCHWVQEARIAPDWPCRPAGSCYRNVVLLCSRAVFFLPVSGSCLAHRGLVPVERSAFSRLSGPRFSAIQNNSQHFCVVYRDLLPLLDGRRGKSLNSIFIINFSYNLMNLCSVLLPGS